MPQCCFAMRALKRTTEPAALDLPWEFGFGRFGFGTLNAASAIWVWQRFVCILCPNLKHHTSGIWHGLMVYIGSVLVYSIRLYGVRCWICCFAALGLGLAATFTGTIASGYRSGWSSAPSASSQPSAPSSSSSAAVLTSSSLIPE